MPCPQNWPCPSARGSTWAGPGKSPMPRLRPSRHTWNRAGARSRCCACIQSSTRPLRCPSRSAGPCPGAKRSIRSRPRNGARPSSCSGPSGSATACPHSCPCSSGRSCLNAFTMALLSRSSRNNLLFGPRIMHHQLSAGHAGAWSRMIARDLAIYRGVNFQWHTTAPSGSACTKRQLNDSGRHNITSALLETWSATAGQ